MESWEVTLRPVLGWDMVAGLLVVGWNLRGGFRKEVEGGWEVGGVKCGGGRLMGERGRGVGGETNGRCRWLRGGEDVCGRGFLVERGTKTVIKL